MHVDNRASESSSTGQEKASCNRSFPEIENVLVVKIILLWAPTIRCSKLYRYCALSIITTLYNLHFQILQNLHYIHRPVHSGFKKKK